MSEPPKTPSDETGIPGRRHFLKSAAAGMAAAAVGCTEDDASAVADTSPGSDDLGSQDVGSQDMGSQDSATPDTSEPTGVPVSCVGYAGDLLATVRKAVELAGGLDAIQPGQTVFIKPNAVHPGAVFPGIATSPDFLKVVIELVKERDPGKIIVGDRSARLFDSPTVFAAIGLEAAALEAGADEVYAAPKPVDVPEDWVMRKPTGWEETWSEQGGVLVMKKLLEADHIINLPVLKNHRWAIFSLALKNFIGGIGDESRDPMHYKEGEPDGLSRDVAILNGAFTTTLNIIDGRAALINGGPEGVTDDAVFSEPNVILASSDRIAVDALGVAILQHELEGRTIEKPDSTHGFLTGTAVWQMPQIVHAASLGLGVSSAAEVALHFDGISFQAALEKRFAG